MRIILDTLNAQGRRQEWLAEQLGVSRPALNRYLHGTRRMPAPVATRACELLGLPASIIEHPPTSPSGDDDREAA